jgi:mismatch-specific thymine-DNA glycosylase
MPGKPVAARGKRFCPAELEAARRVRLADVIADDLVVLFCGANPGLSSAAARAPFATPSDRWWPALYESGFTPRRLAPHEAHEMLALGLGLTSLVRRPTVGVAELAKAKFVEDARLLRGRVLARRPRVLARLVPQRDQPPQMHRDVVGLAVVRVLYLSWWSGRFAPGNRETAAQGSNLRAAAVTRAP